MSNPKCDWCSPRGLGALSQQREGKGKPALGQVEGCHHPPLPLVNGDPQGSSLGEAHMAEGSLPEGRSHHEPAEEMSVNHLF